MPGLTGPSGLSGLSGLIGGGTYVEKVLGYGPIAYWVLNETVGAVAVCLINAAQNGTYIGATLNNAIGPDGVNGAPLYDGVNDYTTIRTAALDTVFDGDEGAMQIWGRVFNAGVWTDGALRQLWHLWDNSAADTLRNYKTVAANSIESTRLGGGASQGPTATLALTTWVHYLFSWSLSNNRVRFYINGVEDPGSPIAGLLAWTGVGFNVGGGEANLACRWAGISEWWYGWLAHCMILDYEPTPTQVADLSTV